MRNLVLLAALVGAPTAQAMDLDPRIEVGANAGVLVIDDLDLINTSYLVKPRIGVWFSHTIGVEVDFGISTGKTDVTGHGFMAMTPQINLVGNPIPEAKNAPIQPILTIGAGMMIKDIDGAGVRGAALDATRLEALASVGTGFIIPIYGPLRARTDLRMMATVAQESDLYISPFVNFEWTAGLAAHFGVAKDQDKDGIPDKRDYCPTEAEDFDEFEDEDGCPEIDNDQDSILDTDDSCPDEREDEDGWEDTDGCPDPDNDGDGTLDGEDICPIEAGPEITGGCPDADGDDIADKDDRCPEVAGLVEFQGCADTDTDGVADPDDECPEEPGAPESFGCPDGDNDRVPDYRDECPEEAADATADPLRSTGCVVRAFITPDSITITESVYFDSRRATIRRTSHGLLDDVAALLAKYTEILKIRVEGHTDDRGDDDANMKLSEDRAKAVVDYLVEKGIDAGRLVAKGFGETKPIAGNNTSGGRAENRRVAFTIIEQARPEDEESEEAAAEPTEEAAAEPTEEAAAEPAEEAPAGE